MDELAQLRLISAASDSLSHLRFLVKREEPEVLALVQRRGSTGLPHYLTSRLGVLPEERWADAVYVLPESLMAELLPRCRELDPPAYVEASLEAAGRALRRLHPAPLPTGLRELAEAVSPEGDLPAAWATWPRSGDSHRDAIRDAMVLREERAYGHYRAAREQGLSPLQLLVLSARWRGQRMDAVSPNYPWSPGEIEEATDGLRERGWANAGAGLTEAGIVAREAIEQATNRFALESLRKLPELQRERAVASLSGLVSL